MQRRRSINLDRLRSALDTVEEITCPPGMASDEAVILRIGMFQAVRLQHFSDEPLDGVVTREVTRLPWHQWVQVIGEHLQRLSWKDP